MAIRLPLTTRIKVKNHNGVEFYLNPGPTEKFTVITFGKDTELTGMAVICFNSALQDAMDRIIPDDLHGFNIRVEG